MNLDALKAQLRKSEGNKRYAYQDHLGYWTIGIGRLIDRRRGGGLSEEERACLLDNDIRVRVAKLNKWFPWWTGMSEARQHVLIEMCFQLGITKLRRFRKTLAHMKVGHWEEASQEMLRSKWARKDTPNRAKRLAKMMRVG